MKRLKLTDNRGNERQLVMGDNAVLEIKTLDWVLLPSPVEVQGIVEKFNATASEENRLNYRNMAQTVQYRGDERSINHHRIEKKSDTNFSLVRDYMRSGDGETLVRKPHTHIPSLDGRMDWFLVVQTPDEIFEALKNGEEDLHTTIGLSRVKEWRVESTKPIEQDIKQKFCSPKDGASPA